MQVERSFFHHPVTTTKKQFPHKLLQVVLSRGGMSGKSQNLHCARRLYVQS